VHPSQSSAGGGRGRSLEEQRRQLQDQLKKLDDAERQNSASRTSLAGSRSGRTAEARHFAEHGQFADVQTPVPAVNFDFDYTTQEYSCVTCAAFDPARPPKNLILLNHPLAVCSDKSRWCVDSGAMRSLTHQRNLLQRLGQSRLMRGVEGGVKQVQEAEIAYHTVDSHGTPVLLQGLPLGLFSETANCNILAQASLMRAGITPYYKIGTAEDPTDGGCLLLRDGRRIPLIFENELWYLPHATPVRGRPKRSISAATPTGSVQATNRYEVLASEIEESDTEDVLEDTGAYQAYLLRQKVEQDIARWCHPGTTKRQQILRHYPHLFPRSADYKRLFTNYRMPLHAVMKGHRNYIQSSRVK